MSNDKITIHIETTEVHEDILNYQIENCPTCGSELFVNFGMAGGGIGAYGFCDPCEKIVWKCSCE